MRRILLAVAFLMAGTAQLAACGDDNPCQGDKNCTFSGSGTHSHTCKADTGCNYTCEDGATCELSCPVGGCNVTARNAKSVTLDCPGNTCQLSCHDTDTCIITGCTSQCWLHCGEATNCQNSCDEMSGCTTDYE